MGMAAIAGPFEQTFILTTHKSFSWNLTSMGLAALQQKMFERIYLSDLGQRSNNDLDLWCSYAFMYWVSQLLVVYQLSVHRIQ